MSGASGLIKQDAVTEAGTLLYTGPIHVMSIRAWAGGAPTTADIFVQVFDATAPTVGTDKADWVILIPDDDNMSSGDGLPTDGLAFKNGIFVAATSRPNNSTAPAVDPEVRIAHI